MGRPAAGGGAQTGPGGIFTHWLLVLYGHKKILLYNFLLIKCTLEIKLTRKLLVDKEAEEEEEDQGHQGDAGPEPDEEHVAAGRRVVTHPWDQHKAFYIFYVMTHFWQT